MRPRTGIAAPRAAGPVLAPAAVAAASTPAALSTVRNAAAARVSADRDHGSGGVRPGRARRLGHARHVRP